MPVKVFISYAHKDECFKDNLIEHMAPLSRAGLITEWNDREIVAGKDWSNEISENLRSADLILFLISSSFLSSDYCVNIEVKTALQMHENGQATLIPIVVRPVTWADSPLSEVQGLPKDAKPISTWNNEDEAWVDVIKGIRKSIEKFQQIKKTVIVDDELEGVEPSISTLEWLDDTEITLTHRNVDKIKLSDIYVIPDVELITGAKNDTRIFRNATRVIAKDGNVVISGEEQQGKTSLLKYCFRYFMERSKYPLLLSGKKIRDADYEQIIKIELSGQYNGLSYSEFCDSGKGVILIDNIDDVELNAKYRNIFIEKISTDFEKCIFTLQSSLSLLLDEVSALDRFTKVELIGLGNVKREEIIKKWLSLGVEQTITDSDLYEQCDTIKEMINGIVKKNIVPPKPIYILMLLQMFEANSKLNLELSSHGHCYQQLIYQAFQNAKISDKEYDKYLNVLTELSWWIFKNKQNPNSQQLDEFFDEYCSVYLKVDRTVVMQKLADHSILQDKDYKTGFKYPYIYYFFVGKKISESYLDSEETRKSIDIILDNLHREDYANILIFVAHHTKDNWVIEKIQKVLSSLFSEQEPASLEKGQLSFMDDFMNSIPELILEQREFQEERDKHNQRLDENEMTSQSETDFEPSNILSNINKTFKGMEIAGQIVKNRHASLRRDVLISLTEDGISSGLRFLKYFIEISDVTKNEIIKVISSHLSDNPNITNNQIEKYAESAYLHLTYGVINGVIRKIAASVGSKEAMEIYTLIENKSATPAMLLLKQSIMLNFLKKIDKGSMADCVDKLRGNHVCTRILKELVIQHIYMFPVDYKEKQQLSQMLGLSVKGQQVIEQKQRRIG